MSTTLVHPKHNRKWTQSAKYQNSLFRVVVCYYCDLNTLNAANAIKNQEHPMGF